MSPQIFVSYSHADSEFTARLVQELEELSYDIWLDRTDIRTGSHWDDEIVRGLNSSQIFLVILSDAATTSQNVKDEIGYAVDHGMQIVPLLIEPCEIPFRIRRIQYVDFTSIPYEDGLESVLEILRMFLPDAEADSKKKERITSDPAALASTVTNLLAPFLAKPREAEMESERAKLPEKVGKLWGAISTRFEGNPAVSSIAGDLAANAQDEDNQGAFTIQLKKVLKEDPDFASILADFLDEAQASIKNEGNGAVATQGGIAVNKIQVNGDFKGNITIGNNNQIGDNNRNSKTS
jgi:hypothetical protein